MKLYCRVDGGAKGLTAFVAAAAKSRAYEPRALQQLLKESPLSDEQAYDAEHVLHLIVQARSAVQGKGWRLAFALTDTNYVELIWKTMTTSGGYETVSVEVPDKSICNLHFEGPTTSVARSVAAVRRVAGKDVQFYDMSSYPYKLVDI